MKGTEVEEDEEMLGGREDAERKGERGRGNEWIGKELREDEERLGGREDTERERDGEGKKRQRDE